LDERDEISGDKRDREKLIDSLEKGLMLVDEKVRMIRGQNHVREEETVGRAGGGFRGLTKPA
jgi:hypothetical protein